jgi:hypothetical protein
MGSLRDKTLKSESTEDTQSHTLNPDESSYLRLLNVALQFHTLGQKIMSGYLYYVATHRLGYKEGVNLQFNFDFNAEDDVLQVTLLPETPAEVSPTLPTK